MISFAIWDQTHLIPIRSLRQYIKDTFYELTLDYGAMPVHHDLNHLLRQASGKHLVVLHSGHTSRGVAAFKQALAELCEQDFLVAGHILQHDGYPHLHPQMMVINVEHYRRFGCPVIGEPDFVQRSLHKPLRSPENVHDDYTPLWLRPTGETVWAKCDFGWNLIHISLEHGLPVFNLPNSLRWAKRYVYPLDHSEQFATCLQELADDRQISNLPSNPNQRQYLIELQTPGVHCRTYLFNTERLDEDVRPVSRLFGVAAGFKLFVLWHRVGGEVVYYDHNHRSLELWQDIVEHWSGVDFRGFCQSCGYSDDFDKMTLVIDALGGEDALLLRWKQFQASKPRFMWCDLLTKPELLVEQMAEAGNCIWYSNCFRFFEGIRRYGLAGCDAREQRFRSLVLDKAPDTVLLGSPAK